MSGKSTKQTRLGVRLRVRLGVATTPNLTQRPYTSAFEGCWDTSIAFLPMHEILRIPMKMDDEFERVCHGVNLILCSLLNISHRLSLSLTDSQWASIADIDSPLSDYHFQATSYVQRYRSFWSNIT